MFSAPARSTRFNLPILSTLTTEVDRIELKYVDKTNLLLQGPLFNVDSYCEDGVRPAALGVHLRLRGLSLLAPLLEDLVDLGLVVDLHFLQPLRQYQNSATVERKKNDEHFIKQIEKE